MGDFLLCIFACMHACVRAHIHVFCIGCVCACSCVCIAYIPISEYIHTQELERQLQQAGVEATIAHLRRRLPARTATGRRQRAMTIACLDGAAVNQVLLCPSLSCPGSR